MKPVSKPRRRQLRGLLLSGLLSSCAANADQPAARFVIDVEVQSDPGKPVAQASISQAGSVIGRTSEAGLARLALSGANGDVLGLRVECPEGYVSPAKALTVNLRALASRDVPHYRARCEPSVRALVVAVRAKGGPDLPVIYLGREVARTDAEGAAHVLLDVPPSEQVTLTLDTTNAGRERLRPRSPEYSVSMPARDELALFDQSFTELPAPVKRRPAKPVQLGPTKITRLP